MLAVARNPAAALDAAACLVQLRGVHKSFRDAVAVAPLDLDIRRGEFFTLLGPSGSGKTTTLRMIAGLEQPSGGKILIDGEDVTRRPPFARDVNTVFQDYALFPHLSVAQNLAYGLEAKRVARGEIPGRVADALRMVQLEAHAQKKPGQLSGGQQQRVALARAIINRPRVLLLDEPLGALDLKLRREMQLELKRIQQAVQITFIYVTHDQEEALTMSDRIAIFNRGRIEQMGSADELYQRPASEFVAAFLGSSNLFELDGRRVLIRPENIRVCGADEPPPEGGWQHRRGKVVTHAFLGAFRRYQVATEDGLLLRAFVQNGVGSTSDRQFAVGAEVQVAWREASVYPLPR